VVIQCYLRSIELFKDDNLFRYLIKIIIRQWKKRVFNIPQILLQAIFDFGLTIISQSYVLFERNKFIV
jgi:hypothetical protein